MAEGAPLEWSMGFRNRASGKYLTQETFGYALNAQCLSPHIFCALNAAATVLKKKQIFYLLPAEGGVYIKT